MSRIRSIRHMAFKVFLGFNGLICQTYIPYLFLGLWNRLFGGWRSVLFCYAGSRDFVRSYAPPMVEPFFRWRPSPIGVLSHNGSRGLVIACPLAEETFRDPSNAAAFQKLQKRIRRIAWALGVSEINMTGTMPSYLAAKGTGILPLVDNRPVVAGAVTEAAREVRDTRFGGQWPPVILIGAGGYIGRPLAEALRAEGIEVYPVDPALGINALPEDLRGRPALVIDAARKGVLEGYLPEMWPGLMILNETFPAPRRSLVAQLDGRGIEVWHLAGLEGRVTPPLPHGYEGAVPCCAAHGLPDPVRVKLANLTERARGRAALSRPEPAQVPALAPEGS